jgi:hypothetical protein
MLITFRRNRAFVCCSVQKAKIRSRLPCLMRLYDVRIFLVKKYFVSFRGFLVFCGGIFGVFGEICKTCSVFVGRHHQICAYEIFLCFEGFFSCLSGFQGVITAFRVAERAFLRGSLECSRARPFSVQNPPAISFAAPAHVLGSLKQIPGNVRNPHHMLEDLTMVGPGKFKNVLGRIVGPHVFARWPGRRAKTWVLR